MADDDSAIWQKTEVPSGDLMQRTERTYERTNERLPSHNKTPLVPDPPTPVDNGDWLRFVVRSSYVEGPADAAFTAFLASVTQSKVLKDREPVGRVERQRLRFFRQKAAVERAVLRVRGYEFTEEQLRVAAVWAERSAS